MKIPFFGSPRSWSYDDSWIVEASLLILTIVWVGTVKIAARTAMLAQRQNGNAIAFPTIEKARPTGFAPQGTQPPLYFKSSNAAFDMACKYLDCTIVEHAQLPAIVLDAREHFGLPVAISKAKDGNQTAVIKVASEQGGFTVPASTLCPNGPDLAPGDLVSWMAGRFDNSIGCWVGFIVAKLKPEIINGKWTIEAEFSPDMKR